MTTLGVIGIGNPIRSDDGIGIELINRLKARQIPEGVELLDVGTSGMNILHHLKNFNKVMIIDAIRTDGEPGNCMFFTPDEIDKDGSIKTRSTHDANLLEALELSEMLGERPEEVIIMGIIPEDLTIGEGLSSKLKEKLPKIEEELRKKIEELT